jgi:hypothetical protein
MLTLIADLGAVIGEPKAAARLTVGQQSPGRRTEPLPRPFCCAMLDRQT